MKETENMFSSYYTRYERLRKDYSSYHDFGLGFGCGCVLTLLASRFHRRHFLRIPNSQWITPDIYKEKRWIKGVVTSVGDADNFLLYHKPTLSLWGVPSARKDRASNTLRIRLAGIDAPESNHFGKTEKQKYSEEAKEWLKQRVLNKVVYCQLIAGDHYGRTIAVVMQPRRFTPKFLAPIIGRNVSLDMLHAGWAMVYEQGGAYYGKWGKEYFMKVQKRAQKARRGQWESGIDLETPAEYKARHSGRSTIPKDESKAGENGKK